MSTLKRNFTMFFHILVQYNPSNRIEKKLIVSYVCNGGLEYINTKIIIMYWKIQIYSWTKKSLWNL